MLKDFFRKLCCCHQWQRYKQANIFEDSTSKRPIMIKEILICTKCGKIKKILVILVLLAALLASCDDSHSESSNTHYSIYVDTIRGHEYIILNGMYFGNIIHSESCQCKKGGDYE